MAHVRTANGAVFVDSTLHPDDTLDLVNAASVLPGLETPLDNSKFLMLQEWPVLTVAQLQALPAPLQGLVRTVKDGTGRKIGRFQFRQGVTGADAGAVSGVSYVVAGDLSGTWFSDTYIGVSTGGGPAMQNSARALIMPVDTPTFATPQRKHVAIPMSALQLIGSTSTGNPFMFNGSDYLWTDNLFGAQAVSLVGVWAVSSSAQSAGFTFRTRLPRGSFAGASIVYKGNNTGAPPNTGVITRPLRVRVYELPESQTISAAPLSTYPSTEMWFDPTGPELKWTGTCGAVGNNAVTIGTPDLDGVRAFHNLDPALVNMASGTTSAFMYQTGGTAAFVTSEEREYMIHVEPPILSGASWYDSGSAQPALYKLEAWIDVTNLGAV